MDNLFHLTCLPGSSASLPQRPPGTWGSQPFPTFHAALSGCRSAGLSVPLRSDACSVLLQAVGTNRDYAEVVLAQYRSDGTLFLSSTPAAAAPGSSSGGGRVFAWPLAASLEPTCMALSFDASVLCLGTGSGDVVLLCVAALLDSPAHGVPFPGVRSQEGLPSLFAVASPAAAAATAVAAAASAGEGGSQPYPCSLRIPLSSQGDAPQCLLWWTPASAVISRAIARSKAALPPLPGTPAAFAAACAGCYLLVGHASGRLSIVSTSTGHCTWSAVIPGAERGGIKRLHLFGDLASLEAHGLWQLPSAYTGSSGSSSSRGSSSSSSSSSATGGKPLSEAERMVAAAVSVGYPAPIPVLTPTFLVMESQRFFLKLQLEKENSDPHAQRRLLAARLIAGSGRGWGEWPAAGGSGGSSSSRGGAGDSSSSSAGAPAYGAGFASFFAFAAGATAAKASADDSLDANPLLKTSALAAQLPQPAWTLTLLQATEDLAVESVKEEQRDRSMTGEVTAATKASKPSSFTSALVRYVPLQKQATLTQLAMEAHGSRSTGSAGGGGGGVASGGGASTTFSIFTRFSGGGASQPEDASPPEDAEDTPVAWRTFVGLFSEGAGSAAKVARLHELPLKLTALNHFARLNLLASKEFPTHCNLSVHLHPKWGHVISFHRFRKDTSDECDRLALYNNEGFLFGVLLPLRKGLGYATKLLRVYSMERHLRAARQLAIAAAARGERTPSLDDSTEFEEEEEEAEEGYQVNDPLQPGRAHTALLATPAITFPGGHVLPKTFSLPDMETSKPILVRGSYIVFTDKLIFIGENPQETEVDTTDAAESVTEYDDLHDEQAAAGTSDSDQQLRQVNLHAEGADLEEEALTISVGSTSTPEEESKSGAGAATPPVTAEALALRYGPSSSASAALPTVPSSSTLAPLPASAPSSRLVSGLAKLHVVSTNVAIRAQTNRETMRRYVKTSESAPPEAPLPPHPSSLYIPANALLQTFTLQPGEAITGLSQLLPPLPSQQASAAPSSTLKGSISTCCVLSTTLAAYILQPQEALDGHALFRRLVSSSPLGHVEDADSKSTTDSVGHLQEVSFALGISAEEVFEAMADDAAVGHAAAAGDNSQGTAMALQQHLQVLQASDDFPEDACREAWAAYVRTWQSGARDSFQAVQLIRRAMCLYQLSSAKPLKPLALFSLVGRPDYGVQAALQCLGYSSATPSVGAPASLSPAVKARLAYALFLAQMMVLGAFPPASPLPASVLSPSAFREWLSSSKDYTNEAAVLMIARCVREGAFCEGIAIGLARGCMLHLLRACMAEEGRARALAEDLDALAMIGESGWGGRFLSAQVRQLRASGSQPAASGSEEGGEGTPIPLAARAAVATSFLPNSFALLLPLQSLAACALRCHHSNFPLLPAACARVISFCAAAPSDASASSALQALLERLDPLELSAFHREAILEDMASRAYTASRWRAGGSSSGGGGSSGSEGGGSASSGGGAQQLVAAARKPAPANAKEAEQDRREMLARHSSSGGSGAALPASGPLHLTAGSPLLLSRLPATVQKMRAALAAAEAAAAAAEAPPPSSSSPPPTSAAQASAALEVAARGRPSLSAAVTLTEATALLLLEQLCRAWGHAGSGSASSWQGFLQRQQGWYRPEALFGAALARGGEGGVAAAAAVCDSLCAAASPASSSPEAPELHGMGLQCRLLGIGGGGRGAAEAAVACAVQAAARAGAAAAPQMLAVLLRWWCAQGARLCQGPALEALHQALLQAPLAEHLSRALFLGPGAPALPLDALQALKLPPRVLLASAAAVLESKHGAP